MITKRLREYINGSWFKGLDNQVGDHVFIRGTPAPVGSGVDLFENGKLLPGRFWGTLIASDQQAAVCFLRVCTATAGVLIYRNPNKKSTLEEDILKVEEALGDEYKKQSEAMLAATLTYGSKDDKTEIVRPDEGRVV